MTQLAPTHPSPKPTDKQTSTQSGQQGSLKKKLRLLIPSGLLIVAAGFGLRYWLTRPDDSAIELSGRIESYESDLGAKVGGQGEVCGGARRRHSETGPGRCAA